jgi:hypothetical protein
MKTEEDEAFDELAKKQGDWGGGFPAKRKMAADKVQEPVAHLWVCLGRWSAYLVENGKQADCAPPSWLVEAINKATTPPLPEQEPVAWTLLLTGEHHGIIGEAGEKFIGAPECYQRVNVYTTPPKREWVGLTEKDFSAINQSCLTKLQAATSAESILKEKNS